MHQKHARRPPGDPAVIQAAIEKLEKASRDQTIDLLYRSRIAGMLALLRFYKPEMGGVPSPRNWMEASLLAATAMGRGPWLAHELRRWTLDFVENDNVLPTNRYGAWNVSRIEDEDLAADIQLHLQSKGKYFRSADIIDFLAQPDIQRKYGLTNNISHATAKRWMQAMDYRYGKGKNGMYIDGHEREDVVRYRQETFLPLWTDLVRRMLLVDADGNVVRDPQLGNFRQDRTERRVILVTHDESTFYANDRRKTRWIHKNEGPTPVRKGEGASLMVSDFCVPEIGWLRSLDGCVQTTPIRPYQN